MNKLLIRLYILLSVFILPSLGLYHGLKYFAANHHDLNVKAAEQSLSKLTGDLIVYADEQRFLVNRLNAFYHESPSAPDFVRKFQGLTTDLGIKADVFIIDRNGVPQVESFANPVNLAQWREAGVYIANLFSYKDSRSRYFLSKKLGAVFGPDFTISLFSAAPIFTENRLFPSDIISPDFYYWQACSTENICIVRFPAVEIIKSTGLRSFFKNPAVSGLKAAFFNSGNLVRGDFDPALARFAFNHLSSFPDKAFVEQEGQLFARVQTGVERWFLLSLALPERLIRPGHLTLLMILIFVTSFFAMVRSAYFPRRVEDLSLLLQILLLMSISSGIPLVILGSVGVVYFQNKHSVLSSVKHQQMIDFVEEINEKLPSEYSRISRLIKETVQRNQALLKGDLDSSDFKLIKESLEKRFSSAHFIKNSQFAGFSGAQPRPQIASGAASEKAAGKKHEGKKTVSSNESSRLESENISTLSNFLLAALNRSLQPVISFERAYMVEMFFQKSIPMVIHDFLSTEGTLAQFAWGRERILLYIEGVKLLASPVYDMCVMISYYSATVECDFIRRNLRKILENPHEFKVYLAMNDVLLNEEAPLLSFPQIKGLFSRITDYRQSEPQLIDHDNQQYLFFAQKGSLAKAIEFCVLFPMQNINEVIKKEAEDLISLAVMAIVIVCFMMTILYLNLLLPVKTLHLAARALEKRDSGFRLQTGSRDEFGEMAEIFNHSMSELEELRIASMVQSKLLPANPLAVEGFSIYGKSIPMADLGGDYFDYFKIDADHFALMLGDVAGHGVGAALIMAIAKAGVICAGDLASDPAAMLARLHQIIMATRSKTQRKVMTFQYLVVDHTNNRMKYANAGGCSPVIVDSTMNCVREISQTGGVLGGFKKSVFCNLDLEIKPGQAMVFYTDGMVESRNSSGKELGYSGLYEIFLASFDHDSAKFYDRIQATYRRWLDGADPGDDLTVMLMVCNDSRQIS